VLPQAHRGEPVHRRVFDGRFKPQGARAACGRGWSPRTSRPLDQHVVRVDTIGSSEPACEL
jgi:hypothetical protein